MAAKDLLSQDEMNALISGVEHGQVQTGTDVRAANDEVQTYDFAHPSIRAPELPALDSVYDRLLRQLPTSWSLLLGCPVEVAAANQPAMKAAEYLRTLPIAASVNRVRVKPLNGTALVVVDPTLAFAVVNQFFGGDARFRAEIEERELSVIEQNCVEKLLHPLLLDMKEAWAPHAALDFEFIKPEPNPASAAGGPNDGMLVTALDVTLGGQGGQVHIALPHPLLDQIGDRLRGPGGASAAPSDQSLAAGLREGINEVKLNVSCTMVETQLSLREVMALKPGDVIPIELPPRVILRVEGLPAFYGQCGVSRGAYAVKTAQTIMAGTRA